MKKIFSVFVLSILLVSCVGNDKMILKESIGRINKVMVVAKISDWTGDVGQEVRNSFGELMVGLPQAEPILSVSQVAPNGFSSMMKASRNILVISEGDKSNFSVKTNVYAKPQTIIYVQGKDDNEIIEILQNRKEEIRKTFLDSDIAFTQGIFKKDASKQKYKTLEQLGISLTIPNKFNTVDDTGDFLWLRNHLTSGIAKTGSNNILVYSVPLEDKTMVADSIVAVRNAIGKKYIPGSDPETMYMITEEAYTPFTFDATIDGKKAYETRGKWEVKNDFMAGPFLNYTVLDEANNRLIVVEGFTYAPSVNKRAFVFELEAIAKSLKIK
ncbi:DUF4837 family protein [Polaribacter dokdonensis]|jgi:hypothetical protein|uniref:DUF4837 domain-containing protein n=1 Tax=Polaribacter dokdonensis DSW-5 TaxID=1300348 RepID=A0A0N0UND5_9FLAO|nr:DUF4837 family protein [Polaribacter dokdonensis]KOY51310.1 hypothetical protein I602_870 [Polaribacter dokdonensis DSW-5]SEE14190.1 protein of unknown function [Polaribacter dokdonensis DSW-5]